MGETFTCQRCGGTFGKGWADEEAFAERDRNFSPAEMAAEGQSSICDDCYQEFMAWLKQHPEVRLQ
jgi:hypothetical protein